jgi:hypothetical protein
VFATFTFNFRPFDSPALAAVASVRLDGDLRRSIAQGLLADPTVAAICGAAVSSGSPRRPTRESCPAIVFGYTGEDFSRNLAGLDGTAEATIAVHCLTLNLTDHDALKSAVIQLFAEGFRGDQFGTFIRWVHLAHAVELTAGRGDGSDEDYFHWVLEFTFNYRLWN